MTRGGRELVEKESELINLKEVPDATAVRIRNYMEREPERWESRDEEQSM